MAPSTSNSSPKPLTCMVFDDLKKGFTNKEVIVRVIHFWEARNPKKGGLLMGLELLLIDQKSTLIQAFITANRIGCYEEKLKPDLVYKIKNFLVIENKTNYRVSSHKFLIQFTHQTSLTRLDQIIEANHSIERQKFRIRSFAKFEEAVDMNVDLYDAIGKMVLINDESFDNSISTGKDSDITSGVIKGKIEVHLQLRDGPVVRLTLWDNVAANFRKKLIKSVVKPVVLLATAVNPRTVRDMFCLSSTSSTRIFFDNDVEPSTEYLTWLGEEGKNSVIINSEVTKSEPATIAELFHFLKNDTPQKATFSCIATILEISPHYGWNFIACSKCAYKLRREGTALVCDTCNNENAVGVIRYRVELSVCDKNDVTTFVLFDREATKLTGIRVADILEKYEQGDNSGTINHQSSIPQCLLDIVGRTYKFQVILTPYNFTATRQTITITRLFEEITAGDKTIQEETARTNQVDHKEAETSGVAQSDAAFNDDDTVGSHHKEKRFRKE